MFFAFRWAYTVDGFFTSLRNATPLVFDVHIPTPLQRNLPARKNARSLIHRLAAETMTRYSGHSVERGETRGT